MELIKGLFFPELELAHKGDVVLSHLPTVLVGKRRFNFTLRSFQRNGSPKLQYEADLEEGKFILVEDINEVNDDTLCLRQIWRYEGEKLEDVKIINEFVSSLFFEDLEYYTYCGRIWNGNQFGRSPHKLGDELREDRFSVPSCLTLENKDYVLGLWVAPQYSLEDPLTSACIKVDERNKTHRLIISFPYTDIISSRGVYEDKRITVDNGLLAEKFIYVYLGKIAPETEDVPTVKNGYAQVIDTAWDILYPDNPTRLGMSLSELYSAKMKNLLQEPGKGLLREREVGEKKYTVWYVAKSSGDKLHPYAGFSWSGYQGVASYHSLLRYVREEDEKAHQYGKSAIDFFLDNGRAECGLFYPVVYFKEFNWTFEEQEENWRWGTYCSDHGNIDMNPLGEELYWILKGYELLGDEVAPWLEQVRGVCGRIIQLWPDGDIPGRVRGLDASPVYGSPSENGFTSTSYLIWAYIELYNITKEPNYLRYAERIGTDILNFALRNEAYWKSEQDTHCLDKRAGQGALRGFNMLYEATEDKKWLAAAIRASGWLATWQWHYNVCFPEDMPLGHYRYRTIGGTQISVEFNGLQYAFSPAAYDWCKLWQWTGNKRYLQRARTVLHQGTQLLFTPKVIKWLNENYMEVKIEDEDFVGAQVEDVMNTSACYPSRATIYNTRKGDIQIRRAPFYSVFGLVMPLELIFILDEIGSFCYSFKWKNGEALDSLELLDARESGNKLMIKARNILKSKASYRLGLLDIPKGKVTWGDKTIEVEDGKAFFDIEFKPNEVKEIDVILS